MVTVSLQEKNGLYHAVLSYRDENGKRKQKWKTTGLPIKGNKRLAMSKAEDIKKEFEQELSLSQSNKVNVEENDILFLDYMKTWLKLKKPRVELNTYGSYEQMVNCRITNYFSEHEIFLKDIQASNIQDFYSYMLNDGLSGNTVKHYHSIIREALEYAFKMEMIPINIADKVQLPKIEQFIGSFYNENDINILLEKVNGDPLEVVVFLTAFYGLRRSEVLGLRWNSIDFENKTITINHTIVQISIKGQREIVGKDRTKNKTSYRTLPLVPEVIDILKELKKRQEENKKICKKDYNYKYCDYICVDNLGNLIEPDYVTKHFKRLLKANNLRIIRFHDLRHSCASLLLARGISLKEIQEWLGHSNFNTTANIYAHLETKVKEQSANVLSNIIKRQKNISTYAEVDIC